MKATLEAINQMQADGVIGKYAIGGAVGATFYLEPAATIDLDIFRHVSRDFCPRIALLSLPRSTTISNRMAAKFIDEYIEIGGWPFSFFRPASDLETEA